MERNITSILDELAPLKTGHWSDPRHSKNWLSPKAKKRRLERRWKSSNEETDRLAYRASCRSANALIIWSQVLLRILSASTKSRRTRGVCGLPSRSSSIHHLPVSNSHPLFPSHRWSHYSIFFQTKDNFTQTKNCSQIKWSTFTF